MAGIRTGLCAGQCGDNDFTVGSFPVRPHAGNLHVHFVRGGRDHLVGGAADPHQPTALNRRFWKLTQPLGGSEGEGSDLLGLSDSDSGAADLNDLKINPTPPNSKTNMIKVLKSVVGRN